MSLYIFFVPQPEHTATSQLQVKLEEWNWKSENVKLPTPPPSAIAFRSGSVPAPAGWSTADSYKQKHKLYVRLLFCLSSSSAVRINFSNCYRTWRKRDGTKWSFYVGIIFPCERKTKTENDTPMQMKQNRRNVALGCWERSKRTWTNLNSDYIWVFLYFRLKVRRRCSTFGLTTFGWAVVFRFVVKIPF